MYYYCIITITRARTLARTLNVTVKDEQFDIYAIYNEYATHNIEEKQN